jgi:ADP-ribose pyrophosphatase
MRLVRRGRWEFVERIGSTGVVAIIATTDDDRLILIEQWREPIGRRCLELPAGLVGDDDPAEKAAASAARELEEETGYRPRTVEYLTEGVSSAGLTSEMLGLFRATGLEKVNDGGGTDGEEITVHAVPVAEVPAFVRDRIARGVAVDLKVWGALWFVGSRSGND